MAANCGVRNIKLPGGSETLSHYHCILRQPLVWIDIVDKLLLRVAPSVALAWAAPRHRQHSSLVVVVVVVYKQRSQWKYNYYDENDDDGLLIAASSE